MTEQADLFSDSGGSAMGRENQTTEQQIKDYLPDVYTEYAMSVISDRAIPDVRDGLKPVQRRILYSMWQMNLTPDKPHKKSARTVGEVLGKYHPHGDRAVYDTLVRLAQDFTMRHPLVDGQGNFGSIDGDPPAAMRYTEARLSDLATEFFTRLKPEGSSVDWQKNFDGSTTEPEVLPVPFPNLLVNGTSGIAVGMSTDIPPHNLNEVLDACIRLIDLKDPKQAQWDSLFGHIKGPDFPTGGKIYVDKDELESIYRSGKGQFEIAAKCHKEDLSPKRKAVVVEELPYSVDKAKLIDQIVELAKSDDDPGINTVRDESDRDGLRLVVECKLGRSYQVVLNNLYEKTPLKKRPRGSFLALKNGVPTQLDLNELLLSYNNFIDEVLVRNTEKRKQLAEDRLHIVRGLIKALIDIDRVIEIVKQSETGPRASKALQHEFEMSEEQAEAVLNRRIRSLTGMNQLEIEKEKEQLHEDIEQFDTWLRSRNERAKVIKTWFRSKNNTVNTATTRTPRSNTQPSTTKNSKSIPKIYAKANRPRYQSIPTGTSIGITEKKKLMNLINLRHDSCTLILSRNYSPLDQTEKFTVSGFPRSRTTHGVNGAFLFNRSIQI